LNILPLHRMSILLAAATIAAGVAQAQEPSYVEVSQIFTTNTKTEIPGHSLKQGTYSIHVVDNLKDRYIVSVQDAHNSRIATFIGLRSPEFNQTEAQGPIDWSNAPGKTAAMRGFSFTNGLKVEFAYPKAEAVELAKLNASSVPAIDPESEGRPADPKLSDEDRQVVTLWMLTSTRVGPGNGAPAIEAKRFQPKAETELAENTAPALPAPVARSNADRVKPEAIRPVAAAITKPKNKAVAARLPQTASDLPLVLLLSGAMLVGGFAVRFGRRAA
jgi:hypothetical protein